MMPRLHFATLTSCCGGIRGAEVSDSRTADHSKKSWNYKHCCVYILTQRQPVYNINHENGARLTRDSAGDRNNELSTDPKTNKAGSIYSLGRGPLSQLADLLLAVSEV